MQSDTVREIFLRALEALSPGHILRERDWQTEIPDNVPVRVIGAGKASATLASAVEEVLGDRVAGGCVVTRDGYDVPCERIDVVTASHPIPDERGVRAADRILEFAETVGPDDFVLVLISGGGSALLASPVDGLTLDELRRTNEVLLESGAPIEDINTIRKHLSRVKGGQLRRAIAPARSLTLIISDVVGDPLDAIASGPTVPDPTTYADALAVITRFDLQSRLPSAVVAHLRAGERGEVTETPKPGDPIFEGGSARVLANHETAIAAVGAAAEARGIEVGRRVSHMRGEASDVGAFLAAASRHLEPGECFVVGGETTVTVTGAGKGGRNQELALAAALELAGTSGIQLGALATDGIDGPTPAAGAVVDGQTVARGVALGMSAVEFLRNNDAFTFLDGVDALLRTGATGTNLNDVVVGLRRE